jgi:hypothetical protein
MILDMCVAPTAISVWDLHGTAPLADAWLNWQDFVLLHPGEHSRTPLPFIPTRNMEAVEWFRSGYEQTSLVHPLGCHFVADAQITGQGYVFSQDRLLQQDAYLSRVALEELTANPAFTPAGSAHRAQRVIEEPILEITGPGSPVFGHWIVDFLPRAAIARELLGPAFETMRIALADHVPGWAEHLLGFFLGARPDQILRYDMHRETLLCRRLCVPTFGHSGSGYFFHSFVREFYGRHRRDALLRRNRRICISRRNFENETRGVLKRFVDREYMEAQAAELGFEIVRPEEHSVAAQYDLFSEAGAIIGEFGSGLHNSLFSAPGIVVGSVGCINSIQHRVAALMSQNILYAIPESLGKDERGAQTFSIAHDRIDSLLRQVVAMHELLLV